MATIMVLNSIIHMRGLEMSQPLRPLAASLEDQNYIYNTYINHHPRTAQTPAQTQGDHIYYF